jgi:hypothetical protein
MHFFLLEWKKGLDDMHVKRKLGQVKIKALESMINEKGEIFFDGKRIEVK